jgi:putative salt-induced outer membrane protein
MKVTISLFAIVLAFSSRVAFADAAAPPAPTGWQSSAAAGLTLTRGNSSTLLATLNAATGKKWDQNEISLGADAAYGKSKVNAVDQTTAGSIHGFGQYNRLLNERLYAFGRLEGLNDSVADIDYRGIVSVGMGYYFIKEKKTDLSAEVGPGFVFESLGGNKKTFVTLRLAEKFHHELSDRARIWESAEIMPQVDKFSNYIVNAEAGIEADLTADKKLSLRAVLQDTHNSQPARGRYKNDAKIITAIAYKF